MPKDEDLKWLQWERMANWKLLLSLSDKEDCLLKFRVFSLSATCYISLIHSEYHTSFLLITFLYPVFLLGFNSLSSWYFIENSAGNCLKLRKMFTVAGEEW